MNIYSTVNSEQLTGTRVNLVSGVYSVLLVGGGGGGCAMNFLPNYDNIISGAGGGSGYAWKGRITVQMNSVVEVNVGSGGSAGKYEGKPGQSTVLKLDDNIVKVVTGGQPGKFVGDLYQSGQYTDSFAQGGDGASGGGSCDGRVILEEGRMYFHPGNGGWNGSDGSGIFRGDTEYATGGKGYANDYYNVIDKQIDPDISHTGRSATLSFGGLSCYNIPGVKRAVELYAVAGGGGGWGSEYLGECYQGVYVSGHGYGAGGGGGHHGIRGFASFIRIGDCPDA